MAVVVNDEMTPRRRRRVISALLMLLLIQAITAASASTSARDFSDLEGSRHRRSTVDGDNFMLHWRQRRTPGPVREGPPIKPEHFRSVAELNKYLADLNEYYTVLGRPRSVLSSV